MNCFSFEGNNTDELNEEDELISKINENHGDQKTIENFGRESSEKRSMPFFATESQAKVIEFPPDMNSILVVKAGPGSGKTSTIVKRIAYMISMEKLRPEEILVLSMANRSVNSLKKYLTNALGENLVSNISINTFHSFCGGLVDQYGDQYSSAFKKKTLMDDLSWRSFSSIFLGKAIQLNGRKMEGNLTPPSLERLLIEVKSGNLTVPQAAYKYKVTKEYIEALVMYLESNGMIRYHDLLTNAMDLIELSLQPQLDGMQKLISLLQGFKAVIVDEFQDIHPQLLLVVKAVIQYPTNEFTHGTKKHLTIAGDPNQSIYEFLGSKPELIQRIELEFPDTEVAQLQIHESFRITPEILNAVTDTCLKPSGLYNSDQNLISVRENGHKPIISKHSSNKDEYAFIASEIIRLICLLGGLLKPSDFAILTRSNKEIEEISKFFAQRYNIKCNRFSLSALWIKSKVHILLDILNVIIKGPGSDFGLLCVLSLLDRKLGSTSRISKLFNLSNKWKVDKGIEIKSNILEEYIKFQLDSLDITVEGDNINIGKNSKSALDITNIYKIPKYKDEILRLKMFMASIQNAREMLIQNDQESQTPKTILNALWTIVTELDLLDYLNSPEMTKKYGITDTDLEIEKEYKMQLRSYLQSFHKSLKYAYQGYTEQNLVGRIDKLFIEYFLRNYNDEIPTTDREMINLSTVHTAKGLEFPVVFLPGVQNNRSLSFWDSLLEDQPRPQSQNKARLFYVACTRAKDLLYVGTSKNIDLLLHTVSDNFTSRLPEMNGIVNIKSNITLLESISQDLHRKLPEMPKVMEGEKLYKELTSLGLIRKKPTNMNHFRQIHTSCMRPRFNKSILTFNRYFLKR